MVHPDPILVDFTKRFLPVSPTLVSCGFGTGLGRTGLGRAGLANPVPNVSILCPCCCRQPGFPATPQRPFGHAPPQPLSDDPTKPQRPAEQIPWHLERLSPLIP